MKIQEVLPDCPEMPDDMRLGMHRKYDKQYLFYRKHKTYTDCFCTSCMKRYRLDLDEEINTPLDEAKRDIAYSISHNAEIYCPECHEKVIAKPEGVGRKNLFELHNIVCFYVKKNKVFAVCGQLVSDLHHYGDTENLSRYYKGSDFDILYAVEYTPKGSKLFYRSWGVYKQSKEMFEPYVQCAFGRDYFMAYNPEVLSESFLKYNLPGMYTVCKDKDKVYKGFKPLLYMMYAVRYPAIEMLVKSGGAEVVREIVDHGRACKSVISLEGKTAAEVFRTDSNDAALIRQAMAGDKYIVDINTLQCWRSLKIIGKRQGRKYKFDDAAMLCKEAGSSISMVLDSLTKTDLTPLKYINYLKKQSLKQGGFNWHVLIRDYEDYIRECRTIGYDTTDDQISRPSIFQTAHERTGAAAAAVERERREKELAEQTRAYLDGRYKDYVDMYEYADERYCIIVPKSAVEIVDEGKNQHHCVAGYAGRHINGTLAILFMRDVKNKDSALHTIEMHGKKLIQIRGLRNCAPTSEARKFVDKWLEWVALPEKKKHPKNKAEKTA